MDKDDNIYQGGVNIANNFTVENMNHSNQRAWSLLCRIGGALDKYCPKPDISSYLFANHIFGIFRSSRDKQHASKIKQKFTFLKAQCTNESNFLAAFTLSKLVEALKQSKYVKVPDRDNIPMEFDNHR